MIALLRNPTNQNAEPDTRAARKAAAVVGQELAVVNASTDTEINAAFDGFRRLHHDGAYHASVRGESDRNQQAPPSSSLPPQ